MGANHEGGAWPEGQKRVLQLDPMSLNLFLNLVSLNVLFAFSFKFFMEV